MNESMGAHALLFDYTCRRIVSVQMIVWTIITSPHSSSYTAGVTVHVQLNRSRIRL
jgi:hypothetical protein